MMSLLEFKTRIQTIYQKYSIYIEPVFKFIAALVVILIINNKIGYDERLKSLPIVLALSLLGAFTPSSVLILIAILISSIHVFYLSPLLALIILVVLLIMYFLYLHFTPKLGYVLLTIPILYALKIPYFVPIFLGLFSTPLSMIASACGIVLVFLFALIADVVSMQFGNTVEDALQIYSYVIDSLIKNQTMLMTILIFSLIILVTYTVKRFKFDYSHEAAVGAGALTSILAFLLGDLRLGITEQIGPMIFGTIISAVLALIIQFFYRALDYSRSEHLQFEDDDYYYYVKAVPKIVVTQQQINIKRINAQRRGKNHSMDYEEDEDDFSIEIQDDFYVDDYDGYEFEDNYYKDE